MSSDNTPDQTDTYHLIFPVVTTLSSLVFPNLCVRAYRP